MQNNRTQRFLLCVLLSLVVHAGLAATFVSAIRSKPVHLEFVNPIRVSLVREVSDAIGTAASQSVESALYQSFDSGTQTNSIDLIQLAEDSTDSTNEVSDELVSAAVASVDANHPTEISDIDQPPPLPIIKIEVTKEIPDAEVPQVRTESGDISRSTEQLPEPDKLESIESAFVKAEEEPMHPKSVIERDLYLTEPVENLASQVINSGIDNEIEHILESDQDLISIITPIEFPQLQMQASADIAVDYSDADRIAGIWPADVREPATTRVDQSPSKRSLPDEIVESQSQDAGIADLSQPVSVTAIEIVQHSPPEFIDDEQFTDELAGIFSSGIVEPAPSKLDQPPPTGSSPEEIVESQIQHAGITDSSHSDSVTAIEVVQHSPPKNINDERITDKTVSTSSLETETAFAEQFTDETPSNTSQIAYTGFEDEIQHITDSELQPNLDITSAQGADLPVQSGTELSADISDADELAGIWSTEETDPVSVNFDQVSLKEPTTEKVIKSESQVQITKFAELAVPIQQVANQAAAKPQPVTSEFNPVANRVTSPPIYTPELDEQVSDAKAVDLNDSWLSDSEKSATIQMAYATPELEPTPIREEIHATHKTPLENEPLSQTDAPEYSITEQVIEPEIDESETKRNETVSETTDDNSPGSDNSSPLTIQESPHSTDFAETDENSIPKEKYQVASLDPVQQTVNSNDEDTANTITQITNLGGITSDVGPKYGIKGLSNQAPRYPYLSRVNDEQGRVILRVIVDRKGRAKEVKILESSGYSRLDKAARKAVKRWRFQPARKNGQSTQGVVQVPINFVLDSS